MARFVRCVAICVVAGSLWASVAKPSWGWQEPAKPDASAPAGTSPKPAPPQPLDARFDELLKRLDAFRQEVEALRKAAQPAPKPTPAPKPVRPPVPGEWANTVRWREIGPAGMGGRITDLAVCPTDPSIYWVATASGGLLKTVNRGVTFEHQFEREATVSIGAVAVAPSNPQIVWVGTGENNPRNSVSYGDGIYKSTDGGKTWKNMGLARTFQIGRIVVHPTNPDVVYVGALGRLYGPHEERGVFKTTDGGATWQKSLFVDERTGIVDLAMNPREPDTLLAAAWERQRDEFDSHRGDPPLAEGFDQYDPAKKWAPGSGLYKTTDGGKTWKRLNAQPGSGLPTCALGRMDVDYYAKDPNVVFAIIDCEKIGMGTPLVQSFAGLAGQDQPMGGVRLSAIAAGGPAEQAGLKVGDIVRAVQIVPTQEDAPVLRRELTTHAELAGELRRHPAGHKLLVEFTRDGTNQSATLTLAPPPLSLVATVSGTAILGVTGENSADGPRVTQVTAGGPADKAGLKAGDILLTLDTQPLPSYAYFAALLGRKRVGERIALVVRRAQQTLEVAAVLAERAPDNSILSSPTGLASLLLGVTGEGSKAGFKISSVQDRRPAATAGLKLGDLLVAADEKPISDARKLGEQLGRHAAGDSIKFQVQRAASGETQTLDVTVTLQAPYANPVRPYTYSYAGQEPNVQQFQGPGAHEYGGVYRSNDGGESWTRVNSLNPRPMYFSQIRVDPSDERFVYVLGVQLYRSPDGGHTFTSDGGRTVHADHHALWINPLDGRHMILGTDGGFCVTYDRMDHWDHINHLAIAQFYHVAYDFRQPYWVYGGLQDNGSWGGPSRAAGGSGILNEDWHAVGGGDGFVCRVDPRDPNIVYSEMQNGAISRLNRATGQRSTIRPPNDPDKRYRFNWNTPFVLSNHNAGIFYSAGNYVFRSVKQGDELKIISPEITRTARGSASALAESPRDPDVLWVGTDDGQLWVTRNGGQQWTSVADKLNLPGPRWIATIEPSRFVTGRCYVALDAHRSNDDEPYVMVTEDFGATWKSLRGNLPTGSSRCLREDLHHQDLLYLGTEFAVWASIDRGAHWFKINNNLPTVAVHELAQHPASHEIVAATHGRSLWICDVALLRQLNDETLKSSAWLFEPAKAVRWRVDAPRATGGGHRRYAAPVTPNGTMLHVLLNVASEKCSLRIVDVQGTTLREYPLPTRPGFHAAFWDLTGNARRATTRRPGRGTGGGGGGRAIPPGEYRVVLTVDGEEYSQTVQIVADPTLPPDSVAMPSENDD